MNAAKMTFVSTVVAAALGLALGLTAVPAAAHCPHNGNENHKHCDGTGGGNPGGDTTYSITLIDNFTGDVVAEGNGVEGQGGGIQGITELGSFETIELSSISTMPPGSNVTESYNILCDTLVGGSVNPVGPSETIESIKVQFNGEIDTLTVAVGYDVSGPNGTQPFILLLDGPFSGAFPPSVTTNYLQTMWNNRGGGKGKKQRCGSGPQVLGADGVMLEIEPMLP